MCYYFIGALILLYRESLIRCELKILVSQSTVKIAERFFIRVLAIARGLSVFVLIILSPVLAR
jgi:hypothetical protein